MGLVESTIAEFTATMKKPRNKKYKPKERFLNAHEWAMAGATKMPTADVDRLMVPMQRGYGKFRTGTANRDDWNDLVTQLLIGEQLAAMNIGNNLLPRIFFAKDTLHHIANRMMDKRSSTCHAYELAAIAEGIDMYKIQIQNCTQAEFGRAHQAVKRTIESSESARLFNEMSAL